MKKRFEGAASTPVAHAENPRNRVGAPREASQNQIAPEKPNRPRNANARLLATIEASVDCVITIDAHSTILEFNAAAERTFGYAREKVIGKPLTEMIIPPSLREAHQRGMAALLKGGTGKLLGKRVEMPAMRSDGSEFPAELTVTQIAGQAPPIFTAYLRDITDRIRAEEALNAQALRYKTLMETSTDSIYVMDEKGDLQEANAAFLHRRGYTAEEVKGLNVADWDAQWSREQLQERLRALVGSSEVFETRHRCKDGSVFDVEVCATSVRIGGEQLSFCVTRDITERKQAEMQARALIDAIPHQIWSGPPDGTLDYCNARWRSYMGIGLKDLQGDGWQTMLHPYDRDRVLKAWHDSVLNGKPYEQEERHLGADGKYRWFLARGVPLRDTEGRIVRWYGTNTDIEDRKRAEEALNAQGLRYRTLMETSTDSIYVLDEKGDAQQANAAFLRRRGYTAEEVKGLNVADWDARYSPAQWQERLRMPVGQSAVFETRHRCKDGSLFDVEVCGTSVLIGGEKLLFCVTRDITERKQADQALRQLAEVSAASSDYVALIGPDFRYQFVNDTYLKARGRHLEDMIGRHMKEIVGEERFEQLGRPQVEACLRGEEVENFEWTDFRSDLRCFLHVKVAPLREPDGTISGAVMSGRDITARYEAEQAQRESEERFRELAENINEVFWVWTATDDPRLLYVSPAYSTIWGRSCESLYGSPQSWKEALHPDDKKWVLAEIAHPDFEKVNDLSYRIVRPDQSIRWIRDRIFPVRDRSGVVVRFAGIAQDITESKTIAEALESAEEQYRSIFNNAVDGIFRTSPDGKLLVTNPAGARIFGFASPEESIEARSDVAQQSYVDPRRREELKRLLQEHGAVKGFEFEAYRKDGSRVWISENTRAVHSPSGEILYFEGIFEDVTELKRTEEALRESEERFRTIFEQAPLGISEGEIATERFISANQRYVDILGYTIDELRTLTFKDYTHPEDLQKDLVEFQKLAAGQIRTYAMEKRYIRKDGAIIWVNLAVSGLAQPGEKPLHCMALIEDITTRKQAEEELLASERRFRDIFTFAPVGIYQSSHDGTLITANKALGEMLGYASVDELLRVKLGSGIYFAEDEREKLIREYEGPGYAADLDLLWKRKDGSPICVQLSAHAIKGPNGETKYFEGFVRDITERKQAETALRESEANFRTLFEQAAVGVAQIDTITGRFCKVNRRYCEIVGYTKEEMQRLTFQKITHPEDLQADLDNMARLHRGEIRDFSMEKRYFRKDGAIVWVNLAVSAPWNFGGTSDFHSAVVEDITERKQAEEELRRSHERFQIVARATNDAVWDWNLGTNVLWWNEGYQALFGYPPEETDPTIDSWTKFIHPEDVDRVVHGIHEVIDRGGHAWSDEYRFRRRDGMYAEIFDRGYIIRDAQRKPVRMIGAMQDITVRKRAEIASSRLAAIVESSADAILGVDLNGIITSWNRGAERIFGYASDEIVGSPITQLIPPDRQKEEEQVLSRIRQGESVEHFETVRIGKGGRQIDISLMVSPIKNAVGDAVGASAVARDITERKRIEKALKIAEEQYHSIFHNAVDGIFRTSPDGKFLVANPAAARILGFASPEELIEERRDIAQQGYVDPHRREEFKRLIQEQGVVNGFEYEAYRKDRSRVWISENTHAVHSPSGEILYFEGIFEDVTERKHAEEALRQSEERFRTIFEQAPLGISEGKIATARFISANQRYVDILGYTADELRTLTFKDFTHPEDLQRDLVEFQKLAAGEIRTYAMEKRYIRKDGAIIWANLTVSGLAPPGEKPLRCIAVLQDISERKRTEQAQERGLSLMAATLESTADGILVVNTEGKIETFNRLFARMWRLSEEVLASKEDARALQCVLDQLTEPEKFLEKVHYLYRHPEEESFDRLVFKDGRIFERYSRPQLIAGKVAGRVWSFRDATERRRAAEKLEEANRQLRVLSRQLFHIQEEERRHLARELHDEIGQTLTAAKINLKIIAPDVPAKVIGRLNDSVQLLDRLLRQVRELSLDLRPPLLDELGLVPTLRWLVDQQAQRAGLRVTFTANVDGVEINPDAQTACFRVAQEAITNVVRHSGAKNVAVELQCEAERLTLRVRDDGAGFDPAVLQQRTPHDFTLGLVSMKERALLVRGGFEVQSAPGQGTEIRAWFPLPFEENSSTKESA